MVDFSVVLWIPYLTFPPRSSQSHCVWREGCTSKLVLWGGRYGGLAGPSRRRVAALSRRRTLGTRALAGHRRVVLYSARAHRACIEYV